MKYPVSRLVVLLVLVAAAFAATAAGAAARTPCGEKVIDDWYGNHLGKKTYPLHCYRDALKIVASRTDIDVYSNARQDILFALQQAIARNKGGGGPQDPTSSIYTADALPSFLGGPALLVCRGMTVYGSTLAGECPWFLASGPPRKLGSASAV